MDFTVTFWHEYILIKFTHKLFSCHFPALLPSLPLCIESFSPQVFIFLMDGVIQWVSLEFSKECGQPMKKMLFPQQLLTACRLTRHSGKARSSWGLPWSINRKDSTLSERGETHRHTGVLIVSLLLFSLQNLQGKLFSKNHFSFQHSIRVAWGQFGVRVSYILKIRCF